MLLCVVVALVTMALCGTTPVKQIARRLSDQRARLVGQFRDPVPEIVVVGIDDESLQLLEPHVGRWPWPRAVIGSLVNHCSHAKTIGLDILFSEQDYVFQGSDDHLVAQTAEHGSVVCSIHLCTGNTLPPPPAEAEAKALSAINGGALEPAQYTGALVPYPKLLEASAGLGVATQIVDPDGVARRYAMLADCAGHTYPSLALALATQYLNVPVNTVTIDSSRICHLGDKEVALDKDGALLLDFPGKACRTISAADLLLSVKADLEGSRPTIRPEDLAGKIVLIGSTATGLHRDQVPTPLAPTFPGVHVHAIALDNLLRGVSLLPLPAWLAYLLALGLVLPIAASGLERPLSLVFLHGAVALAYVAMTVVVLSLWHLVLPLTGPVVVLLACGAANGVRHWRIDQAERLRLEHLEAAKQRFTDMLVHDLKNRVAPVSMALGLLERIFGDHSSMVTGTLAVARASSDRLLCEIKSLLDIRKMSEGRLQLKQTPVLLSTFLDQDLDDVETAAAHLGYQLSRAYDSNGPTAEIDRNIVSRVLANLLWNAFEHGEPDSTVEVGCAQEEGHAVIWVANRGPVIPEGDREAIFEAYTSNAKVTGHVKLISGTGLGLTFCKLAVAAHAGEIAIESPWEAHDDGVKFRVILPLQASDETPQAGETWIGMGLAGIKRVGKKPS